MKLFSVLHKVGVSEGFKNISRLFEIQNSFICSEANRIVVPLAVPVFTNVQYFFHSNEFALIMSSFHEKGQELINQAEQGEWSLACDEKLLELMQNVASVS